MRIPQAFGGAGLVAITLVTFITLVTLIMSAPSARADGVIAVGRCDRYGYTYGYPNMPSARATAVANCAANGDGTCQVVVSIVGACGAFAVSGDCGARGWAYAPTRGRAERLALDYCARYGGHHCIVRMWVCDGG